MLGKDGKASEEIGNKGKRKGVKRRERKGMVGINCNVSVKQDKQN